MVRPTFERYGHCARDHIVPDSERYPKLIAVLFDVQSRAVRHEALHPFREAYRSTGGGAEPWYRGNRSGGSRQLTPDLQSASHMEQPARSSATGSRAVRRSWHHSTRWLHIEYSARKKGTCCLCGDGKPA